jgi:IS1 family transposase
MNVLPREKQITAIAALSEGMSIRSVERLTGIHRDTVMRLGARVGRACAALHDQRMVHLEVTMIEMDELWGYVGKKQRRVQPTDGTEVGDQYVFMALASFSKAIFSYLTGKRNNANTDLFVQDVRWRVNGTPQINSDAWAGYQPAIGRAFGRNVTYGQIVKSYDGEPPVNAARRYSPGLVVDVKKRAVFGRPAPETISTSYVERRNLNVRMDCRRFTRLTNGYSKKLDNHEAAVSLFVACYNFCRPHSTLRGATPAMALGLTDHPWSIAELMDAADEANESEPIPSMPPPSPPMPAPVRERPRFTVIQGGRS